MIPLTALFEEAVIAASVPCRDCFSPAVFRWRKADWPPPAKALKRKCSNCAALARARKKKAEAEARRARERELIERGREQVRRYIARKQRERRQNLKSVPKHLRPKVEDAAS